MLSVINDFQHIPDEIRLSSLYINRYFSEEDLEKKDNVTSNDTTSNDTPINDTPINDTPSNDTSSNDTSSNEIDISSLFNMIPYIPMGIVATGIGIGVYTAAAGITIAIGTVMCSTSISLYAIANLGGLTNMYRHSKYIASFITKESNKITLLDKEVPKSHVDTFATPYVYYKIVKSINEFNHLSESNKLLIVKYVKENKEYDYDDIKNNEEIKKLYTRIFFNYNSKSSFLDDLVSDNLENIKHSSIESLFISNYFKFLIKNHIMIVE